MTHRCVVAGAPLAGKSTYVRQHAAPGDLVYDYDTLHQALSGLGPHEHLDAIRPYVLAARDAIFADLEAHGQQPAWLITSTRSAKEAEMLAARFGAEIVFLEVSREEAHRRADDDGRPAAWHEYIDSWFDETDIASATFEAGEDMHKKTYRGHLNFKADSDDTGRFSAVFATLNVVDHDGDVTLPGAFRDGQEVLIEGWNHDYSAPPVGKGVIHQDDERAWVDGQFFLDTQAGIEHYRVVKNVGELQEWSYTFVIEDSERGEFEGQDVQFLRALDVWGVAPVTRGAGIGTRTTAIKRQKGAVGPHSTGTTDAAWDGPANEARVRSDEDAAYYRRIYAWQDPNGDVGAKASWRFIHHMVDGDGNPGAANIRACQTGIGVLNGGRGGTTIPDADRQGVYNHLARHLRDADLEPPELRAARRDDGEGEGDGGVKAGGEPAEDGGGVKPSGIEPVLTFVEAEFIDAGLGPEKEK